MPDALAGDRVTLGARVRDENTSTYYSRKAMSHSGGSSRSALGTLTNCSGVHMREQPNCKTPTSPHMQPPRTRVSTPRYFDRERSRYSSSNGGSVRSGRDGARGQTTRVTMASPATPSISLYHDPPQTAEATSRFSTHVDYDPATLAIGHTPYASAMTSPGATAGGYEARPSTSTAAFTTPMRVALGSYSPRYTGPPASTKRLTRPSPLQRCQGGADLRHLQLPVPTTPTQFTPTRTSAVVKAVQAEMKNTVFTPNVRGLKYSKGSHGGTEGSAMETYLATIAERSCTNDSTRSTATPTANASIHFARDARSSFKVKALEESLAKAVRRLKTLGDRLTEATESGKPIEEIRLLLANIDEQGKSIDGIETQIRSLYAAHVSAAAVSTPLQGGHDASPNWRALMPHREGWTPEVSHQGARGHVAAAATMPTEAHSDRVSQLEEEVANLHLRLAREESQKQQLLDRVIHLANKDVYRQQHTSGTYPDQRESGADERKPYFRRLHVNFGKRFGRR